MVENAALATADSQSCEATDRYETDRGMITGVCEDSQGPSRCVPTMPLNAPSRVAGLIASRLKPA